MPPRHHLRIKTPPELEAPPPAGAIDIRHDPRTGEVYAVNASNDNVPFRGVTAGGGADGNPGNDEMSITDAGTYNIPASINRVFISATTGDVTVNTPDPVDRAGTQTPQIYTRMDAAGDNEVWVVGPINGTTQVPLANQYASMSLRAKDSTFIISASNNLNI